MRKRTVLIFAVGVMMAVCPSFLIARSPARRTVKPPRPGVNMLANGNFEKPMRNNMIPGWYHHMTDYVTQPIKNGPTNYICGACDYDFKNIRPWRGLHCPKCSALFSGHEDGKMYIKNHEAVTLEQGRTGKGPKFTLSTPVGNVQGVRIFSEMFKVKRGSGFKFAFDVRTSGPDVKVFVEGFRYRTDEASDPSEPEVKALLKTSQVDRPVERIYRKPVHTHSPGQWTRFETVVLSQKERYEFDYVTVNLYAYLPGEAWFDNVVLMPMTPQEIKKIKAMSRKQKSALSRKIVYR